MSPIQLYDARTRAKQPFVPADPSGRVGLFVCGPTVMCARAGGHFDQVISQPTRNWSSRRKGIQPKEGT